MNIFDLVINDKEAIQLDDVFLTPANKKSLVQRGFQFKLRSLVKSVYERAGNNIKYNKVNYLFF